MPATIRVERLRRDGPFRVDERYEVAHPDPDEHLSGTIREIRPTGPQHVEVTVELDDDAPTA
jgi:hypothetical protein